MTSSFQKIYGFAVQTKTQRRRFQIYPLWDPVSKNIGFTLPKRRIPCGRNAYPIKNLSDGKKGKSRKFVVSLSNVIGLCRRHWLGHSLSAITFSYPPKTSWHLIELKYSTHTQRELSHIDCVCENGVIQLKVFSPAFACMSVRGRGLILSLKLAEFYFSFFVRWPKHSWLADFL